MITPGATHNSVVRADDTYASYEGRKNRVLCMGEKR